MKVEFNFKETTESNLPPLFQPVLLKFAEGQKEYYGDGIFCGHRDAPVKNEVFKNGEFLGLEFDEDEWMWIVSPINAYHDTKWEIEPECIEFFAEIC